MRPFKRYASNAALALAALLISVHTAFSVTTLGDYRAEGTDAGPALAALLHGNLVAFARANPAMGDLSLLIRAPFVELAYIGHPSELSIYRWGVLPCVASVAVLALWLVSIARRRGTGPVGQWAILLVSLLNPLVSSAVAVGHPEELMTASLCIGALVAAFEGGLLLSTVLLGLALACKQWSVLAVLPVLLALERGRMRALIGALALAAVVTLPEVVGAPRALLENQLSLAHHDGRTPSVLSWWWPLAPNSTVHLIVEGSPVSVSEHRLPRALVESLHSVIIVIDVLIAAIVAHARRLPLRRDDAFALMAIVMLLRCTLDTQTVSYYHAPLFLDLLAWDALRGERIPVRALTAAAVAYLLLDRLNPILIGGTSSLLYAGCTAAALVMLVRTLAGRSSMSPRRIPPRVPATA